MATPDLIAAPRSHAVTRAQEFLQRFGLRIADGVAADWQAELIDRAAGLTSSQSILDCPAWLYPALAARVDAPRSLKCWDRQSVERSEAEFDATSVVDTVTCTAVIAI